MLLPALPCRTLPLLPCAVTACARVAICAIALQVRGVVASVSGWLAAALLCFRCSYLNCYFAVLVFGIGRNLSLHSPPRGERRNVGFLTLFSCFLGVDFASSEEYALSFTVCHFIFGAGLFPTTLAVQTEAQLKQSRFCASVAQGAPPACGPGCPCTRLPGGPGDEGLHHRGFVNACSWRPWG